MDQLGFPTRWTDRIMTSVSTLSYSFLINGKRTDVLHPHRGLFQGDLLSLYLFLLCATRLGSMIDKAQDLLH